MMTFEIWDILWLSYIRKASILDFLAVAQAQLISVRVVSTVFSVNI